MTQQPHVVCFGKDEQLLKTRAAVLAREFRATPVETLVSFLNLSQECQFEVAVLCHTLPEAEYEQAVTSVHSCCPRAGIVAMTLTDASHAHRGSDCTLRSQDGPAALLGAVRSKLIEKHLIG